MPLDPEIRVFLDALAARPPATPFAALTAAEARRNAERLRGAINGPTGRDGTTVDGTAPLLTREIAIEGPGGVLRARLYVPPGADRHATGGLVYFHGGGWVIGDLSSCDALCRALCRDAGQRVVAVEYRLAPEHPFPAAVDDAVASVAWVASHATELGIDPSRLAVGGDSAGGNLAAVAALDARDAGPTLCGQVLIYPVTDSRTDTPSYEENATGFKLEREGMRWFLDRYARDEADRADPRFAPLRAASHAGLPPALVVTAGYDPLRDDGTRYARALAAAGVAVTLLEHPTLIHGFVDLGPVSAACREALAAIGRRCGDLIGAR